MENYLESPKEFVYKVSDGEVVFYFDLVTITLKEKEKNKVIQEMVGLFTSAGIIKDGKTFYENLLFREKLGSTGFGNNAALPYTSAHIKEDAVVSVAISKEGVEFNSLDGKPVKIIFMSAMNPGANPGIHLKFLGKSARLLKEQAFREKLINAESKEELFQILKREFQKLS